MRTRTHFNVKCQFNPGDLFKVAPYRFTIARALMTKAQVICTRSKENIVFRFS